MAIKAAAFERDLVVVAGGLSPQAVNALLARTAKAALAEAIASGAASSSYVRAVNGRLGAPEESVSAPGPIVYTFNHLDEIVFYALAFARARSPKLSGDYRNSWFALVNDQVWDRRSPIPLGARIVVTNDQPYSRKIEVGSMRMSLPPGVVEDTRQAVLAKYGKTLGVQGLSVNRAFVQLQGGYVLKGRQRARLAKQNDKSAAFRAGRQALARRKELTAGQPMKYPALTIGPSRFA